MAYFWRAMETDAKGFREHDDYADVLAEARRTKCKNPEQSAVYVLALALGEHGWRAAEVAGYSAGTAVPGTEDYRKTLAAASTRAKAGHKIKRLLSWYIARRQGQGSSILGSAEVMRMLSDEARQAHGNAKLQALKALQAIYDKQTSPEAEDSVRLPAIVAELCRRDNVLLQTIGVAAGRQFFRLGVEGFERWTVPEGLERLANLLESELDPLDVFELGRMGKDRKRDDGNGSGNGAQGAGGARSGLDADAFGEGGAARDFPGDDGRGAARAVGE